MISVRLHFARNDMDVETWETDHALGRTADKWPYGFHRLGRQEFVVAQARARLSPLTKVGRRLAGGYDWDRYFSGGDVAVCWDERTGVPVALSGVPTLTGVIWLTEPRRRRPTDWLAQRALGRASVFVNSRRQIPALLTDWKLMKSRVHHVPFGVDKDFWKPVEGERDGVIVVGNDRHRDHVTSIRAAQVSGAHLTMVTSHEVSVPSVRLSHVQLQCHVA